jgi:hypothetical protein
MSKEEIMIVLLIYPISAAYSEKRELLDCMETI